MARLREGKGIGKEIRPGWLIYRWPLRGDRTQARSRELIQRSLLLEGFKETGAVGAEQGQVEAEGPITTG